MFSSPTNFSTSLAGWWIHSSAVSIRLSNVIAPALSLFSGEYFAQLKIYAIAPRHSYILVAPVRIN
jgi:hypothetical protein